jgi:hypothetical protein
MWLQQQLLCWQQLLLLLLLARVEQTADSPELMPL